MASMLRYLRYLRPVINGNLPLIVGRSNQKCCQAMCRDALISSRVLMTARTLSTRPARKNFESTADSKLSGPQKLDRILNQMDIEVRRTGRISLHEIQELLKEIEIIGTVSSTQSLLLIRCCGSLLPEETNEVRTKLVNDVLALLKNKKFQLDISHYNALLKVHLENQFKFSPTDFLAEMEALNIEPNRVTYQRLITYYCQQGDLAGASKILEFMKSKSLPINESVFNSLILGHSRLGELEQVKSILEVMKASKLEPSAETYLNLCCGHAERGNVEEILKVIDEAEKNDYPLLDKDLLDIIYTLAVHGHKKEADKVAERLKRQFGYNQDVMNVIFQLVNKKQDETAYKLLLTMVRLQNPTESFVLPTGQFFIRHLVKNGYGYEEVLKYCMDLKERNVNNVGVLRAAESSLVLHRPDLALKFIKALHKEGTEIRQHYFWPILLDYKNDTQKMLSVLKEMCQLDCQPLFDTLLDYVFPYMNLNDPDAVVQQLKDIGISQGVVVTTLVAHFIDQNNLLTAAKLTRAYPVRLIGSTIVQRLCKASVESRDLPNALVILQKINVSGENQNNDYSGQFLMDYYKNTDFNSQKLEEVLTGFKNHRLSMSLEAAEFVTSRFRGDVPKVISDLLNELRSSQLAVSNDYGSEEIEPAVTYNYSTLTIEDAEKIFNERKGSNTVPKGVLRRLLTLYTKSNKIEKIESLLAELQTMNFQINSPLSASIAAAYVFNNNFEKASKFMNDLYERDENFVLDDDKVLNYAALLAKNKSVDEALDFVSRHHEKHGNKDEANHLLWPNYRLVNAVAEKGDPQLVNKTLELLYTKNYAQPANILLGPLIKVHLNKNDYASALEEFGNCCKKYNFTPMKNELFEHFIKEENADSLQKVVDYSTEVHGEMNTMFDLAFSFLQCKQLKQAKKILDTPGLRARPQRLQSFCEILIEEDKIDQLAQLVDITKDLFNIDRDEMSYYLIRGYAKIGDPDKALGVWTMMQEESVIPSNRTLALLGNVLKTHNRPVPFLIPEKDVSEESAERTKIHKLLRNNLVDEALEIKRAGNSKFTPRDSNDLLNGLLNNGRLNEALNQAKEMIRNKIIPSLLARRELCRRLAVAGDVDAILSLAKSLSADVRQSTRINGYLARAYFAAQRYEELVAWMERTFEDDQTSFPASTFYDVITQKPEYFDRLNAIAEKHAANNYFASINAVWAFHMVNEDFAKAHQLYNKYLKDSEKLMIMDIVTSVKNSNNEAVARKLVDVTNRSKLISKFKCTAYIALMDVLNYKYDYANSLKVLEEATSRGLQLSEMKLTTLQRLRNGLKSNELAVPDFLNNLSTADPSGDSSSSSDSDDDKKKKPQ